MHVDKRHGILFVHVKTVEPPVERLVGGDRDQHPADFVQMVEI